jgi:hypothetical protein
VAVSPWAFPLGFAAVVAHFLISGNLLFLLGVDYVSAGGNPLVKLHPGTFLAAAGAMLVLLGGGRADGLRRMYQETPALAVFMTLIPVCAIYSVVSVGFSGVGVYVESYFAPGLVVLALCTGTPRQLRILGYTVLAFALVNVVISVGESLTQTHMIPMQIGDVDMEKMQAQADADDFRGAALYDHPLTGALVTALSVFMLLGMRLPMIVAAPCFTLLLVGLLAFGGRAAMGVTIALVVIGTAATLMRGLATRRLSGSFLAALCGGLLVLPPIMVFLVTSTDIGARIMSHLYVDDSAQVRNIQWDVLGLLDMRDMLFGVSLERTAVLKTQIGLDAATTDIENFWLLMFLNLGIIGFLVYLVAFFSFLFHLGRRVRNPLGWAMVLGAVLIASTSNSLGRKSSDLVFLAVCMLPLIGFAEVARHRVVALRPRFALSAALRRPGGFQPAPTPAGHTYRMGGEAKRRSHLSLAGMSQP